MADQHHSSDEDSVTTDEEADRRKLEAYESSDYSSDEDTELPQVTTLESVLAMVPFTPDWWEARAANEALHNRGKMKAETARAKHLVKLCEAGMHTDALQEQLADTYQDFTNFNHVKDAMRKHDQWVWKPPRSLIKSADASGADKSKLESSAVLRKVLRDFRMMTLDRPGVKPMHLQAWPSVMKKERNHASMMAELLGKEKKPEQHLEEMRRKMMDEAREKIRCQWTHFDEASGKKYLCSNERFVSTWRKVVDRFGVSVLEEFTNCAWHMGYCAGDHGVRPRVIATPNNLSLCTACYVRETHVPPDVITKLRVPGVLVSHKKKAGHAKTRWEIEADARKRIVEKVERECLERRAHLTASSVCTWVPDKSVPRERGLMCENLVMISPVTGEALPSCPWHRTQCVMPHETAESACILVPNGDGLCVSHYVAKYTKTPVDVGWPLPGSELLARVMAALAESSSKQHIFAPVEPFIEFDNGLQLEKPIVYVPPQKQDWFTEQTNKPFLKAQEKKRYAHWKKIGTVQAFCRAHIVRNVAYRKRLLLRCRERVSAVTCLQAVCKSFTQRVVATRNAKKKSESIALVQKIFRGMVFRRRARTKRNALRLNKYGNVLKEAMARQTINSLQMQRRETWRELRAREIVNRVMLGCVGRFKAAAARRLFKEREKASTGLAKIIRAKLDRKAVERLRQKRAKEVQKASYVQALFRAVLCRKIMRKKIKRRRRSAINLQRCLRGMRGRIRGNAKRQMVKECWRMVGPVSPQMKRDLEALLPKASYPLTYDDEDESVTTATTATSWKKEETWFKEEDAIHFVSYDELELGRCSKFEFRQAMHALWKSKGLTILPSEVESWCSMFDRQRDGVVHWRDFLDFARMSHRPCSLHRRIVCAVCIARGPCMRKGCDCDCYLSQQNMSDLICKRCGHTPMTHLRVPTCCVEPDVHGVVSKTLLNDIFHNRSDAPTKPRLELGPLLAQAVLRRPAHVEASVVTVQPSGPAASSQPSTVVSSAPYTQTYKEPLPVNADVCIKRPPKLEGFDPNRRSGPIPQAELQALRLLTKHGTPGTEYLESISVMKEEEEALNFREMITPDELRKGFGLSRPIPLILDGELRLSTDPTELYLELLDRLGSEELNVKEGSDGPCVALCFRNDVFLERHWKKLLRDIRYGTLNRHLALSSERRAVLKTRLYAKPKHADALEDCLRRLGFHARSAERSGNIVPIFKDEPVTEERAKNADLRWDQAISLALGDPAKALEEEKPVARIPEDVPLSARSVPDDFKELDRETRSVKFAGSTLSRGTSKLSSVRSRGSRGSSTDDSEPTSRASSSNMGRTGTTRPSVGIEHRMLERRNSASDMRIDATQPDVHKLAHDIATRPRTNVSEWEPIKQERRRMPWLCPHPGCGAVFSTKSACQVHSREAHLGRKRLAIATPEQDQFMRQVWPDSKMPWDKGSMAAKAKEKCLYQCPICMQPCVTHDDLKRHLKLGHTKRDVKKIYVQLKLQARVDQAPTNGRGLADVRGKGQLTPPFPPPKRAPLAVCLKHKRERFRCWDCGAARRMKGLVAPMRFYPEVVVKVASSAVPGERPVVADMVFAVQSERCPYTLDEGEKRPCQLIAACRDEELDVWVCVAYFLDIEAVKALKGATHRLFDEKELYEDSRVTWLRAEKLAGYCYVLHTDKKEYYHRKQMHLLPVHRDVIRFSDRLFDFATRKSVKGRKLDSEVSALDLGLTEEAYGVEHVDDKGLPVTAWSTDAPKYAALARGALGSRGSLLDSRGSTADAIPTDAGMAAAIGLMGAL